MTIDEMKARIKEAGYTYKHVSELSGVPLSTIQKVFSSATSSPRYETLRALEAALMPSSKKYSYADIPAQEAPVVKEAVTYKAAPENDYGIPGKKQGEFTLEDYLALPAERRVELIDGVFYDMAAPTGYHQFLAGEIYRTLMNQAKEQGSPCRPFISPLDVQIDKDDSTVVQPDVFGTCDPTGFMNGRYFGAPDLIIEVISPSSRRKDIIIKGAKYATAGVKEYWMIDLQKKQVIVYVFTQEDLIKIYSITDDIPVTISNGRFHVDFSEIYEDLTGYFPELKEEG